MVDTFIKVLSQAETLQVYPNRRTWAPSFLFAALAAPPRIIIIIHIVIMQLSF